MKSAASSDPLRDRARKIFETTREIDCPAFPNEKVYFRSKALNHIFYKGDRSRRDSKEKEVRIKLLPSAIKLLKIMPVWQHEQVGQEDGKVVQFWAFEGVIAGHRTVAIVKQVGAGYKQFWSVIPSWKKKGGSRLNSKMGDMGKY